MKPEDFRSLLLKPGTLIGLAGDYSGDSEWSHGELIQGELKQYIVVEHNDMIIEDKKMWDAAAIISLQTPLKTIGLKSEAFWGRHLLLIQRYAEAAWDANDPVIHVFGIKDEKIFIDGAVLSREVWQPKTVWLASAAVMTVEDDDAPSEMALAFRKRAERKQLELK